LQNENELHLCTFFKKNALIIFYKDLLSHLFKQVLVETTAPSPPVA
jgi:hypothetical protein